MQSRRFEIELTEEVEMSEWTATECARALRAPAGFESEEDGVGGRKAREEVSSLPVPRAPSAGPARGEEGG